MSPSFDGVACAEDGSSVLGDGREGPGPRGWEETGAAWRRDGGDGGQEVQGEELLGLFLDKQCQHLTRSDYLWRLRNGDLDSAARKDAVDWIGKVHSYFSFGPLSAYLSINYLDRFLSSYELPRGKAWMTQLLAVACLSLAAKMEETDVPLPQDLQVGEAKHVFEARTIRRMELLVLSTLSWRMQTVTPFNFLDFFLRKINGDDVLPRLSMSRSIQLVLSLVKGIEYLEFRPSEVAAAVAISVARENQALDVEKASSLLAEHVQKEKLVKCIEMISEKGLIGGSAKSATSAASAPQSPIGVLDAAACLSYKSDKTGEGEAEVVISTGGNSSSSFPSSHDVPDNKRRRID